MPLLKPNSFQRAGSSLAFPFVATWRRLYWFATVQNRERVRLWNALVQMRGLMSLWMKQRHGYQPTEEERRQVRQHLRKLRSLSPYLFLLVMPGGVFALPVLAWWVDRRRLKHVDDPRQPSDEESEDEARKSTVE